jgi:hypothetical protein
VADSLISYGNHVRPLFRDSHCLTSDCHGQNAVAGGLSLRSYLDLMRGGDHGPAVVPRHSAQSSLWFTLLADTLDIRRMPTEGFSFLTAEEVLLIADWIDQGARYN